MSVKPADKVTKLLTKLIDYSIFPAVLVITSKLLGILLFINFFSVTYKLDGLKLVMSNNDEYALVNSYSSLIMIASVVAGLILILFKAHVLHNTHISPGLSAKVHEMNLEELISSTKTIYSQSFIWIAYIWLIAFVLLVQAYYLLSYYWIFYIALSTAAISTFLVWYDLKKEFSADSNLMPRIKKLGKGLFTDYSEQAI